MLPCRSFIGISAGLAGWILSCSSGLGTPPAGYLPVYSEEFNGTNLNRQEWSYRTDAKTGSAHRPENVSVGNGLLRIALKKEPYNGRNYTAGGVVSFDGWRYGYYETRMRVWSDPNWHAAFWTAHWLSLSSLGDGVLAARDELGGSDVPRLEIDFIEQDSANTVDYNAGVIHWFPGGHEGRGRTHFAVPDLSVDFHTVGGEVLPDRVRFYFDGQPVKEAFHADFAHADSFVWLTCIANSSGVVDVNLPGESLFDYFRFYGRQDVVPEEFEIHNVQARRPLQTRNLEVLGTPDIVVANDPNVYRRIAWQLTPVPGGGFQFRNSFGALALQSPLTGLELEPVADVRIREGDPNNNQGPAADLIVGPDDGADDSFRSLLEFDVSSLNLAPDSVSLQLTFDDSFGEQNSLTQTFMLHELNAPFVEAEATWNSSSTGNLWGTPGGDFNPAVIDSVTLDPAAMPPGAVVTFAGAGLTAAISNALSGDGRLRLLLSSSEGSNTLRSVGWIRSREDSPSLRPKLRIYDETFVQPAARDVRLRSGSPDVNQGATNNLGMGPIQSGDVFRTVFEFDMNSATLPLDALALELTLERDGSPALTNLPQNFTLHLLEKAFVEGEASWNSAASGDLWASPGGDFGMTLSSANVDPHTIATGAKLRMDLDSSALASVNALLQSNAMLRLLLKSDAEGAAVRSFIWINSREDLGKEPRLLYGSAGASPVLVTDTFVQGDLDQVFVLEEQVGGEVAIRHQASGHYVRMADGLLLPIDVELKPLASLDARARWTLVPANTVERYFPGTATLPDRWYRTWMGHLYESDSFPYVFHREFGWIYLEGSGGANASFYHPALGWMWTGPEFWPLAYSDSSSNWVAIERGTNGTSLRAFDFAANAWTSLGSVAMGVIDMQALVEAGDDSDFAPPGSGAPAPPGSVPSWSGVPFTPPLLVEAGELDIRPTGELNKWLLLFNSPVDRRHRLDTSTDIINWAPLTDDVLFPGRTHYLHVGSVGSTRYFRAIDEGAAY
jgi:hypothetical protein